MKRVVVTLLLASIAGCGARPARVLAPPSSVPPSARDVASAITAYADVHPPDASCASVAEDGASLGQIEAHLLGQLAEAQREGDAATLDARCEGASAPWTCRFGVRVEAEDPWSYAITFTLDADGAIDLESIRCPGTG